MARRALTLIDQLEQGVQAMLARPVGGLASKKFDPTLAPLLNIARDLRDLPREDFKARLKNDLKRSTKMENAAKQAVTSQTSKAADAVPSEYHTIAPYIIVPRAAAFIDFLKAAFGASERFRFEIPEGPGLLMHAEVSIGNSIIELADSSEKIPPAPQTIHLYFDDADAFYARALQAGATSIYKVADHVSGDRQGAVRDPFGNIWYIAMIQGWTPGPEGVPSVQPYLHLVGAAKMIPFLESAFGAEVQGHVPRSEEGKVLHATMKIGDTTLELDEAHGEFQPMPCHLHLHVNDADALYVRALRAGATSIDVPSDKPYGRSGGVKDAFGNSWYVTSPLPGKS
jgi:PhnB protein